MSYPEAKLGISVHLSPVYDCDFDKYRVECWLFLYKKPEFRLDVGLYDVKDMF